MVEVFLTIWVKNDPREHFRNMKLSCVGRGLMGYIGNKGSISVSMLLHQTSFCIVCSHLTSGQKEGDELHRNSDVMEILKKTSFPRVYSLVDDKSTETAESRDKGVYSMDGKKDRYISPHHTTTQISRIDTQGTICSGRKNDERQHGMDDEDEEAVAVDRKRVRRHSKQER